MKPETVKASYFLVLRNRNFTKLWIARLVSNSGDAIFLLALVWLVLESTGSVLNAALVVVSMTVPMTLFTPVIGIFVDRWDRKKTMVLSNFLQALVLIPFILSYASGGLHIWKAYVTIFLLSTISQFSGAAERAAVPMVVDKDQLITANALSRISSKLMQVFGYTLGGTVVALIGALPAILYYAFTFVFSGGAVASMTVSLKSMQAVKQGSGIRRDFLDGVKYIRCNGSLMGMTVLNGVANFCDNGILILMPVLALETFRLGASGFGFLWGSLFTGVIVGSLIVGKVNGRRHIGKIFLLGLMLDGLFAAFLGISWNLVMALVLAALMGLFNSVVNVPFFTFVQATVPNEFLGRVFTVILATLTGVTTISMIVTGIVSPVLGVTNVYLLYGGLLALIGMVALPIKKVRKAIY